MILDEYIDIELNVDSLVLKTIGSISAKLLLCVRLSLIFCYVRDNLH